MVLVVLNLEVSFIGLREAYINKNIPLGVSVRRFPEKLVKSEKMHPECGPHQPTDKTGEPGTCYSLA